MLLMDKLMMWNVRGLNSSLKQQEVIRFILQQKVGLVGLVKTKIKNNNFSDIYSRMFQNWSITTNFHLHKGA